MDAFLVAVFIGVLLVSYYYMKVDFGAIFKEYMFMLRQESPLLGSIVTFVTSHVAAADIIGIIIISFFSKLFFLPLPTEPYMLYAYSEGANIFVLVIVSAFFGTLASAFNYGAGKLLRHYIFNKSPFANRLLTWIESSQFLGPLIFGAALLPVPDVTSLVFGASNIGVKRFIVYTFFGLLVKGYVVILAYDYIAPYLSFLL